MSEIKDVRSKEIIIRIKRRGAAGSSDDGSTKKKRGGLIPEFDQPIPSRRRTEKKGIRFFDPAFVSGEQTLFLTYTPPLTLNPSDLEIDLPSTINGTQYQNLLDQIYSHVFGIPQNQWIEKFKKLTETDTQLKDVFVKYVDDVDGLIQSSIGNYTGNFADWKDDQLVLSNDETQTLEIKTNFFGYSDKYVKLSAPPGDIKITGENSPSADPVEFIPSANMDIFIIPAIVRIGGETKYHNGLHVFVDGAGTHSDVIEFHDVLFGGFQVIDRRQLDIFYNPPSDIYQEYLAYWNLWKTYPGAIAKRGKRDFYEFAPYSYYQEYSDLSPANFPYAPLYTPGTITESAFVYSDSIGRSANAPIPQITRLIFVIKQNNRFFYFWDITP